MDGFIGGKSAYQYLYALFWTDRECRIISGCQTFERLSREKAWESQHSVHKHFINCLFSNFYPVPTVLAVRDCVSFSMLSLQSLVKQQRRCSLWSLLLVLLHLTFHDPHFPCPHLGFHISNRAYGGPAGLGSCLFSHASSPCCHHPSTMGSQQCLGTAAALLT